MDSSNGFASYKLEAIKTALANGELSKEEISKRLTYAIDKEYEKQHDERDVTFIIACQKILYEMHTGKAYASQKEESKQVLLKRMEKKDRRHGPSSRMVWRSLLVASAFLILGFGVDALVHREWLDGTPSADDQLYIVDGNTIDVGAISEGSADESTENKQVETTDVETVVETLGFKPAIPQWIPDGWELDTYYAAQAASSKRFIATYSSKEQEYYLVYQIMYYSDTERASAAFEQSRSGEEIELATGQTVYMTVNQNDTTCVWYDGLACYNVAGPETRDAVINLIESIKENE